jgi:hypothetical protein
MAVDRWRCAFVYRFTGYIASRPRIDLIGSYLSSSDSFARCSILALACFAGEVA